MDALSVTSKGQVTIPKKIRQKLGIGAGSRVVFRLVGDRAELLVVSLPVSAPSSGAGLLRHKRAAVPVDFDVASLLAQRSSA